MPHSTSMSTRSTELMAASARPGSPTASSAPKSTASPRTDLPGGRHGNDVGGGLDVPTPAVRTPSAWIELAPPTDRRHGASRACPPRLRPRLNRPPFARLPRSGRGHPDLLPAPPSGQSWRKPSPSPARPGPPTPPWPSSSTSTSDSAAASTSPRSRRNCAPATSGWSSSPASWQGSHDPAGVVFTVLPAPSGMEREYIRDRTLEGHESARRRGKTQFNACALRDKAQT